MPGCLLLRCLCLYSLSSITHRDKKAVDVLNNVGDSDGDGGYVVLALCWRHNKRKSQKSQAPYLRLKPIHKEYTSVLRHAC
jgi:hypothetical protein